MFPEDDLGERFDLTDLEGGCNWKMYRVRTPAHRFTHFLKWFPDENLCVQFSVRDNFSALMPLNLAQFTDAHLSELSCKKKIAKIEAEGTLGPFSAVVYIAPECHSAFKVQIPRLYEQTLVGFPVFDCEFSGDESVEEIICIRRDFLASVDWRRDPVPKILMRYKNHKTKSNSVGGAFGLASLEVLVNEVLNLEGAVDSTVEVINYLHQKCSILSHGDVNFVSGANRELSPSDSIGFVKKFVLNGQ